MKDITRKWDQEYRIGLFLGVIFVGGVSLINLKGPPLPFERLLCRKFNHVQYCMYYTVVQGGI